MHLGTGSHDLSSRRKDIALSSPEPLCHRPPEAVLTRAGRGWW